MNSLFTSSLPDYRKTVFKLSDWLRQLNNTAEELGLSHAALSSKNALNKIEDNNFSIAVVGEFKRGKSTLINALLGKEILPADIVATTATLNRIKYGIRTHAEIHFKNGQIQDIDPNQLARYVTKLTSNSAQRAETVKEAVIYHPIAYCKEGVSILDTPGLADEAAMTNVTLSSLSSVDAAIFVVMAQTPFSQSEQAFLSNRLVQQNLGRILFVVNGIDRCHETDSRSKAIQRVKERIVSLIDQAQQDGKGSSNKGTDIIAQATKFSVIGISAYQALQAKIRGDSKLLEQSHFSDMESALEQLLEERGELFLKASINRTLSVGDIVSNAIIARKKYLSNQRIILKENYEQVTAMSNSKTVAGGKAIARRHKEIDRAQNQLNSLFKQLQPELQRAIEGIISKVTASIAQGEISVITERMNRLEKTIATELENRTHQWGKKIQSELTHIIDDMQKAFRPDPTIIAQWINALGLYEAKLGATLKQHLLKDRPACQLSVQTKESIQLRRRLTEKTFINQFKISYVARISDIIEQEIEQSQPQQRQLCIKLKDILTSTNPENWQTEKKIAWVAEQRLAMVREETHIDISLRELNKLQNMVKTIQEEAYDLRMNLLQS